MITEIYFFTNLNTQSESLPEPPVTSGLSSYHFDYVCTYVWTMNYVFTSGMKIYKIRVLIIYEKLVEIQ